MHVIGVRSWRNEYLEVLHVMSNVAQSFSRKVGLMYLFLGSEDADKYDPVVASDPTASIEADHRLEGCDSKHTAFNRKPSMPSIAGARLQSKLCCFDSRHIESPVPSLRERKRKGRADSGGGADLWLRSWRRRRGCRAHRSRFHRFRPFPLVPKVLSSWLYSIFGFCISDWCEGSELESGGEGDWERREASGKWGESYK
ncbi:hypothetical protein CRG98_032505 [Punica granatum]|uniref:Uncharacterized protein n=1 Tax=Punica granatum TaxID=22663 RepID=A0A2I0ISW2_PUNGR|nr:hypothetical protein CRG98_032505 [Punica granatum]